MKTGYSHLRCGLIGEKLGHSFSPIIHSKLADYSFELCELAPSELENFVRCGPLDAFCVTIPYKQAVLPFLDEISHEALSIGAVNVVVREKSGKIKGYNTDYFGFDYMLTSLNLDIKGKKAVVFGKGGAALTACAVLRDRGIDSIEVIGSKDNTEQKLSTLHDRTIIVNATPVGMYPKNGISPASLEFFPNCEGVLDVIYNPARTALLLEAEKKGIPLAGGLSMLVAQATKAFEYFTDDKFEEGCIEKIIDLISKQTRNIILIGMPGCGKSTVGKELAQQLGRDFFDADEEFEKTYSKAPSEIINAHGEEAFRKMEHEVLTSLGKKSSAVIATGGGAVTREYNYDPLHQNGVIIFLERELSLLPISGRPLSQSRSPQELYNERIDKYIAFADIRIESQEEPTLTAQQIIGMLEQFNSN